MLDTGDTNMSEIYSGLQGGSAAAVHVKANIDRRFHNAQTFPSSPHTFS